MKMLPESSDILLGYEAVKSVKSCLRLKVENGGSSHPETKVPTYVTTQYHNPEDRNLNINLTAF
jgi:hypothetical protein